jgi:hypothetical protein
MTMWRTTCHGGLAGLAALLIAGCGGGGGGGGDGGGDTGGIDRGGITTSGTITGFGSVHVNGVRYQTTGATFTIDDQPGQESELRVGQVVTITGTLDSSGATGTATRVVFDDEVEGNVQSIDVAGSRLVVLGRTVNVSPATSFDDRIVPRSLEGLQVGDRVEVSGFVAADGSVGATRIERKPAQASSEVKGFVTGLDTVARRFTLGSLTVSYATAQLADFPSGQPVAGDLVEAKGALDGAGLFVATRVEKESGGLDGRSDDRAEVEGLVTRFVSTTDFGVGGQRVVTNATTIYEGGNAASLALDVKVEVEGRFDATGAIVASKVQFRREVEAEFEGRADAVNVAGNTLVVLGITFRVNALTRFEDHSSADVARFGLPNIVVGDFVEVDAYRDGADYVATKIERDDASNEAQVEGIAQNVSPPSMTVAGVAVTTDATTEFRDQSGATVSSTVFFQAAPGRLVKVRGTLVGGVIAAQRAELED